MSAHGSANSPTYRFWVLVMLILVAGFVQGMLLPVLSVLLEEAGVPSAINGLNATALYIGILLTSPFIEHPVRRFGYKPVITIGVITAIVTVLLFPVWQAFWFWFVLRMLIGMGDNLIHFATQVWITSTSSIEQRGRSLAIYGLSFGLGFGVGPLMTRLLEVNEVLPFLVTASFSFLVWLLLLKLRNEWPTNDERTEEEAGFFSRYKAVWKLAWFALLPGFIFGYLESTIHGSYPVYAMRMDISLHWVTLFLPTFVIGSLITQLPLGILSDRYGRKRMLMLLFSSGIFVFAGMYTFEQSMLGLFVLFALAGMLLGSLYSLGLMYLADLLPPRLLPTGNVMIAVSFSLGSMLGPVVGGTLIEEVGEGSLYLSLGAMLFLIWTLGLFFRPDQHNNTAEKQDEFMGA
ncbi:MFS transporter [Salsuginibacillus kocurii]|uniref:MFS transporter n=1 Tax=Salsuginibacillus kocurii TaxID=427078 RepID=UPI000377EDB1|nr:MFS transporter [Salsuginibacillus kocurii]